MVNEFFLDESSLIDKARFLFEDAKKQQVKNKEIDLWLQAKPSKDFLEALRPVHTDPNSEKALVARLSATPILDLIVSSTAQQMVLEGVNAADDDAAKRMFLPWERNGLVSRQYALWHGMLTYGEAYALVLPGTIGGTVKGENSAWIGAYSPKRMHVWYEDPVGSEFPTYALRYSKIGETQNYVRLYDYNYVTDIALEGKDSRVVNVQEHGMGECPVVRFSNELDLDGSSVGEVEKYQLVAQRFYKSTQDRLLAQHYNSWKIRYATGLDFNTTEEAAEYKNKLGHEDVLTGGEGVTFGTLAETQLDGLLKAAEADRDMLAAVSQTPVWNLNGGNLINLSAEALSEARSMQRLKVSQKQKANGVNIARVLRLAAFAEGRIDDSKRYDLTPVWEDVETRVLSQAADGLQKLHTMGIPAELLVEMIPNLSKKRSEEWREHILANSDPLAGLSSALSRQVE